MQTAPPFGHLIQPVHTGAPCWPQSVERQNDTLFTSSDFWVIKEAGTPGAFLLCSRPGLLPVRREERWKYPVWVLSTVTSFHPGQVASRNKSWIVGESVSSIPLEIKGKATDL